MTGDTRFCNQGDCSVAVATKSENKNGFVRDFLSKHPEGNVKAVNEAWTDAGMKGAIGATLIYGARAEMGLSGKLRAKTRTAARAKSPTKMSKPASSPGKSMFVKEYLNDHPKGNVEAVNKAWAAAGFEGTISKAVVDKMRASLGLTGNTRQDITKSKPSPTATKSEQRQKKPTTPLGTQPRGNHSIVLEEMEADIDRLIFKTMAIGNFADVEDALRRARRLLYTALIRG